MTVSSKKDCVDLYLDNEFYDSVNAEIVFKLKLKPNQELNIELLDEIYIENKVNKCMTKALSYMTKNLKTEQQLKNYLYEKMFDSQVVEIVVNRLKQNGIVDDKNYAKLFVESYKNKKGKLAINQLLKQKGINQNIINEVLSNFASSKDVIKNMAEKYLKNKPADKKTYSKLYNYLMGKGFTYTEIKEALNTSYDQDWD